MEGEPWRDGWFDRDGIWRVGCSVPSNHVLDGGPHPASPMVRGNLGGISSPIEKRGIACSRVFSGRRMIRVSELSVGFVTKRLWVRFPVGATLCNDCGQVDFFGDDAAFYRSISISCCFYALVVDCDARCTTDSYRLHRSGRNGWLHDRIPSVRFSGCSKRHLQKKEAALILPVT